MKKRTWADVINEAMQEEDDLPEARDRLVIQFQSILDSFEEELKKAKSSYELVREKKNHKISFRLRTLKGSVSTTSRTATFKFDDPENATLEFKGLETYNCAESAEEFVGQLEERCMEIGKQMILQMRGIKKGVSTSGTKGSMV